MVKDKRVWSKTTTGTYFGTFNTEEDFAPGFYNCFLSNSNYFFQENEILVDNLFQFQNEIFTEINNFVEYFFENPEEFKDFGVLHKAGVLTFGLPGNGKTSIVLQIIKRLIEKYKGVALQAKISGDLVPSLKIFREIEPERPLIVVLEEIDKIYNNNPSAVLSLLDGVDNINHVLYLATTNDINALGDNLKNRPSRFHLVTEIFSPSEKDRLFFIEQKIAANIKSKVVVSPEDAVKWARETKNFSIDQLKGLIDSILIYKQTYEKSFKRIKNMCNIKVTENHKQTGFVE